MGKYIKSKDNQECKKKAGKGGGEPVPKHGKMFTGESATHDQITQLSR